MTDTPECFTPLYPTLWELYEEDTLLAMAGMLPPETMSELERGVTKVVELVNSWHAAYEAAAEDNAEAARTVVEAGVRIGRLERRLDDKDAEIQAMQLEIDLLRKRIEDLKRIASVS